MRPHAGIVARPGRLGGAAFQASNQVLRVALVVEEREDDHDVRLHEVVNAVRKAGELGFSKRRRKADGIHQRKVQQTTLQFLKKVAEVCGELGIYSFIVLDGFTNLALRNANNLDALDHAALLQRAQYFVERFRLKFTGSVGLKTRLKFFSLRLDNTFRNLQVFLQGGDQLVTLLLRKRIDIDAVHDHEPTMPPAADDGNPRWPEVLRAPQEPCRPRTAQLRPGPP